jgi:hypothetical protein
MQSRVGVGSSPRRSVPRPRFENPKLALQQIAIADFAVINKTYVSEFRQASES